MKTAKEIIDERERLKNEDVTKTNSIMNEYSLNDHNIIMDEANFWIGKCENLVEELSSSGKNVVDLNNISGQYPCEYYDRMTYENRKLLVHTIAKPFIKNGFNISINLPWDDWSGGHGGNITIRLPNF